MFKALRDRTFLPTLAGVVVILAALLFLGLRMAWYPMSAQELAGTYHRASVAFLHVDHLPTTVTLRRDGTMGLFAADGKEVFSGNWTWDDTERMARIDDPRWDRQIRLRSTLGGPRLCMRVSPLPFEIDHPEHDEEVDLVKDETVGHP